MNGIDMRMVDVDETVLEKTVNEIKPQDDDVSSDGFYAIDKTQLITRGKLYPHGLNIFVRPLLVPEVKKLSSIMASPENAEFVINDIFKKAIKGIDITNLYMADRYYLLFLLRAITFKDVKYTVPYHCDKCKKDASYHFTVNNLQCNYIKDDYNAGEVFDLMNGDKITFKHLQAKDMDELENIRKSPMAKKSSSELDLETLSKAASINTINGNKMSLINKYNYINESISPEDYSDILMYLDKIDIGISPFLNVTCDECGGPGEIPVTFHSSFCFPVRKVG